MPSTRMSGSLMRLVMRLAFDWKSRLLAELPSSLSSQNRPYQRLQPVTPYEDSPADLGTDDWVMCNDRLVLLGSGQDGRDVVAAAGVEGQLDEVVARLLSVRRGVDALGNDRIGHHIRKPIATDQQLI